jgi:tetratricopeptide (TPR) repeat protein
MEVKAWYEKVVIPTYGIGKPEKIPMFPEKRIYQGSSGIVYPHPVIEKISDEKTDMEWDALFLENQYLKIMILPGLGGRIQMAFDKSMQRHFVYYNQVIKPALVGLTGPWISGGIEFNWPQHHRPSTFEPLDHSIETNEDGSVTVWCSEVERMFRTRGMTGFTMYPDKAYLEVKVRLYNRTDQPQSFLWWANPAVKVNDHYQSVFPPDVNAVYDHGKRDVSEFPVARGTYYKVDYSPGTDISRYSNIPVPTSYMAIRSDYDFVGGYEHDTKGGLLHVANHHISPGKKQWTWGHGDFGKAWDRNLTDEDGPYIELMCGVYTDNQPDFSWLMPGEEKSFSQYFMPYRDLGVVRNATKEAMVSLETEHGTAILRAYATAAYPAANILLTGGGRVIITDTFDFHPGTSYEKRVPLPEGTGLKDLRVEVTTAEGLPLISWQPESGDQLSVPEPAKAARNPGEIESADHLYLTGLHLEQYRHATYDPRDYYLEALARDPGDSRCNNALGLWYLRRGSFLKAENYFRKAIATLTKHNPNPIDGEPYFNLGIALRLQQREEEAYDAFYKSVWNAAWQDSGYFQLARLAAKKQSWSEALELVDRSLARNFHHHKARQLKTSILRKMNKTARALLFAEKSLRLDKFNFGLHFEKCLLDPGTGKCLLSMKKKMRGNIHTYIEFALDFASAGLFDEAIQFIDIGISEQKDGRVYPMALYYKAWFEAQSGALAASANTLKDASLASPDYCFPNQNEAVVVLEWAKEQRHDDARAPLYLGTLWYAARNYEEAISNWELSAGTDPLYPVVHRNLALAYFNKKNDPERATREMEKAFALDNSDSRILMELDQLYKRLNIPPVKRLQHLDASPALVTQRDDLYLERAVLLNLMSRHQEAYSWIMSRKFHPWEGGEGKVTGQYVMSLTEMAKKEILNLKYKVAVDLLEKARDYPENLGEGKLFGARENEQHYWLGVAYGLMGEKSKAARCWENASEGSDEPSPATFYNDQQPDAIFYQGLALLKLGRPDEARERFGNLIAYGKLHENDNVKTDYFAVSLPDLLVWEEDATERNRQLCMYLTALGKLGAEDFLEAIGLFNEIISRNQNHPGSHIHRELAERHKEFKIF